MEETGCGWAFQTTPGSGSRPFRADLRVEKVAGGRVPVPLSLPGPPVSSVLMGLISRLQAVEASLRPADEASEGCRTAASQPSVPEDESSAAGWTWTSIRPSVMRTEAFVLKLFRIPPGPEGLVNNMNASSSFRARMWLSLWTLD